MNAYELSEKKNKLIDECRYLEDEIKNNNTGTVLLSNDEVDEIINALKECIAFIDSKLRTINIC